MRWRKEGNVAEAAEVHIAENSPEEVAFKLLYEIAEAEGMQMRLAGGTKKPDRQWILDTYAECIMAVRTPIVHASSRPAMPTHVKTRLREAGNRAVSTPSRDPTGKWFPWPGQAQPNCHWILG
jgi:hypothetical protein